MGVLGVLGVLAGRRDDTASAIHADKRTCIARDVVLNTGMRISEYTVAAVAAVHKALGDPTRLRIVSLLAHRGELCVCDVESILEVSQSKASRHLTYLKHAGVVVDRRDGAWVYYRLVKDNGCVRSAAWEIKKSLADDEQAQKDLSRAAQAAKARRLSDCSPIELAKGR